MMTIIPENPLSCCSFVFPRLRSHGCDAGVNPALALLTISPLAASAVDTLGEEHPAGRVNSCVCHWLLVYLTAWVSMKEQVWVRADTIEQIMCMAPDSENLVWTLALSFTCMKPGANLVLKSVPEKSNAILCVWKVPPTYLSKGKLEN